MKALVYFLLTLTSLTLNAQQWSVEKANHWYDQQPWLVGCNFLPSTAINQIEMWQSSSWDIATIERELTMAEGLGFNTVRVYLHDLVYKHEKKAFLKKMDEFLSICASKNIKPLFVFFDDCHNAKPQMGKQPEPIPGVHNSGWKQSPGYQITHAYQNGTISKSIKRDLEKYVKGVLSHFENDERILGWDIYNEPGHSGNKPVALLKDTWKWAWEVRPSQPLTACVKGSTSKEARAINAKNSDVYSFHCYDEPVEFKKVIEAAITEAKGRPVLCTEYMARITDNTFQNCMPVFKEKNIACWNWGLVDGKSATKWSWKSRKLKDGEASPIPAIAPSLVPDEPELWFHEIFRNDGTPYKQEEVDFIKKITTKKPNIILYLADDLGWKDVGFNGAKVVKTPHLDQLAKEGTVFDNAFIASPACAPSRAALLTALMPARNGAEANHTWPKPEVGILTKQLQENGYKIYSFGKIAHGKKDNEHGLDYFDISSENMDTRVKAFFSKNKVDGPVCVMIGDRRPHVSWTEDNIYNPKKVDLPDYLIDTKETREHRARYYSDITGFDKTMGNNLALLENLLGDNTITIMSSDHGGQWPFGKWNLYDDGIRTPLVVKWKGKIEAGRRTKAMVSWIDILPTLLDITDSDTPENLDGKSFAKVLTGESDKFRNEIYTTHSSDGFYNVYPIRSVRTMRYKYIKNLLPDCLHTNHSDISRKDGAGAYWDSWDAAAKVDKRAAEIVSKYYQRPAEEFYDLNADPNEQNNLINNPKYQSEIKVLKQKLTVWIKEQGDQETVFRTPYPVTGPKPNEETILKLKGKRKKK